MKFYDYCRTCFKKKFFIRKRTFKLPGSKDTAKNRDEICGRCARNIKKLVFERNK